MSATLGLTLFVEIGRVQEAALFYTRAFAAEQLRTHQVGGQIAAIEMQLGNVAFAVAGSNPKREQEPERGGPFFPKAAGAVNAIVQLTVADLDAAVRAATGAGAMIRDRIQPDQYNRRVASIFDPFGHIWGLVEPAARQRAA
jgi:uncharacterized glyoxalase superfamily protein PhnB